jgi:hypothetical protein
VSLEYEITEVFDDLFRLRKGDVELEVELRPLDGLEIRLDHVDGAPRTLKLSPEQAQSLLEWLASRL